MEFPALLRGELGGRSDGAGGWVAYCPLGEVRIVRTEPGYGVRVFPPDAGDDDDPIFFGNGFTAEAAAGIASGILRLADANGLDSSSPK